MTHHDTPSEISTLIAVIKDLQARLDKANKDLDLYRYISTTNQKQKAEAIDESQAD